MFFPRELSLQVQQPLSKLQENNTNLLRNCKKITCSNLNGLLSVLVIAKRRKNPTSPPSSGGVYILAHKNLVVHQLNILEVDVHFRKLWETLKKVTQQLEEKRLPSENQVQLFGKFSKTW